MPLCFSSLRRRLGHLVVASVSLVTLGSLLADTPTDPLGEKVGGDTTVFATGRNAFSFPAANLSDAERTQIRRTDIGFVYQSHRLLPKGWL